MGSMPLIQKILVPVDGSPPSIAALQHAVALAKDLGATIHALHVEDPSESGPPEPEAELERALDVAEDELGERLYRHVERGEPLRTILEVAGHHRFDLIVMGTHGRVGRIQSLVGSVAEGVVRNATCPVQTVRAQDGSGESFAERVHHRPSVGDQTRSRH